MATQGDSDMALEIRGESERGHGSLIRESEAWICVYKCMFLSGCADELARARPDCGGELVPRPRPGPHPGAGVA